MCQVIIPVIIHKKQTEIRQIPTNNYSTIKVIIHYVMERTVQYVSLVIILYHYQLNKLLCIVEFRQVSVREREWREYHCVNLLP